MRHCLGQQPFKYFVETDPTVPQWVKKITLADIQNWNTVLNKQDILEAGQHIIIDGNVISFDHTIDELASDFQYFKIGDERIYNDLRNYFITINEEEFIPIDILTDTAFMQWQDGLYYVTQSFDIDNTYKVVNDDVEYDVLPYWARAIGDPQVFIDLIESLDENETLAYYKEVDNEIVRETLSIQEDGDEKYLADSDGIFVAGGPKINALFEVKEFVVYNTYTASVVKTVYVLSDYDIKHSEEVELDIVLKITGHNKVQPTDEFDSTNTYYEYNRNTDTYSTITLNENTFKQRQNGLYIRNAYWDKDTLLTAKNIDQLLYDLADTAFGKAHERAYSNFVTYELKNYVTGRISALHIEGYLPKITFTNKMTDIENTLKNLQGVVNETNISIGGKQDTLSVIGDGLVFKSPYDYDGSQQDTTNKILSLGLDIWDDAHSNEYYKDEYRTERGYNGDDFGNLVHFHYKDTDNKIYLAVPFSKRLMYEDVAISSKAILNELNLNYEMKLATLDSNINFVDLDYYKNKWGVTGDNFTKDDYKTLLKEWYSVELDANDPNNQTLVNLYSYDGHNDKYYGRQRAIVINLSTENEIYTAVEWLAIENHSESDFNSRTESWWYSDTIDGVKNFLSEDDEYPGNDKYYWKHGDIKPQTTIPSVDAVARFVESLDLDYTDGKVKLSITERPNTYPKVVNIDEATIVDDSAVNSNNTWSSNKISTELAKYVTLATTQTITGNKTFSGSNTFSNVNTFTNQIVLQGINSMIVGSPDGLTKKALLQRTSLNNTNLIVLGNTSDTLELRGIGTRPTYNSNESLALLSDVTSLPKPMIYKGTIGTSGTIEWSNLETPSESNKGWTYKVITAHATTVSSPSGNPKSQNWYELDVNNRYVLTEDTSVVSGKTYYENASNIGDVIISNPDINKWENIPSGDEPSGTVTNIATASASGSHLTLTGGPITSTGTIIAGVESGYSIPSTTKQTEWDSKIAGVQLNSVDLTKDANNKVNVIVPQVYRFV